MVRIYYNNARARTLQLLDKEREGSFIWVETPTEHELEHLAERFNLELDLLRDAIDPNESPRVEREGGKTYIFTRYCLVNNGKIATAPFLIIYAEKWLIAITNQPFGGISLFTDQKIEFLTTQKAKLLLQLLTQVNLTYTRQINIVSKQIWRIRSQLSKQQISNRHFIEFIDIEETLNDFVSSLVPMNGMFRALLSSTSIRFYEDDRDLIEDLTLGTNELIELAKSRLKTITNIREAYSTIMANNLNRVIKLMTALTILITIPNIVTGAFGMNVAVPIAHWPWAFWSIMGLMAAFIGLVAWLFKRNHWF